MSSEHRIESFDPRGVFIECAATGARTYIDRDQGGATGAGTCVCGTTVRATWSAAGCVLDALAFGKPRVDLPRLHRFLVEHETEETWEGVVCTECNGKAFPNKPVIHDPDCEWVALVEMTRPAQTPPEEARS